MPLPIIFNLRKPKFRRGVGPFTPPIETGLDHPAAQPSTLWTPSQTDITGLARWHKADAGVTLTSGFVSQWDDYSGNANHLAQGTAANRPAVANSSLNSLDGIDFDGTDDFMDDSSQTGMTNQTGTYFCVYKHDSTTGDQTFFDISNTTSTNTCLLSGWFSPVHKVRSQLADAADATFTADTNPHLLSGTASTSERTVSIDGMRSGTKFGQAVTAQAAVSQVNVRIGVHFGGYGPFNGKIHEIVWYNSVLSNADREKVEGYLAHKWGLQGNLDAAHTYKVIAPQISTVTQNLAPALFTETDEFYAATVSPGAVDLAVDLFTETDTFYAPTVSSTYALTPSLHTEADTFYDPTVTVGAANLSPPLYTEADAFYSATVGRGAVNLAPPLYEEPDTFYSPTVAPGAVNLAPSLFTDSDTFYSPTVSQAGGGTQDLTPALHTEGDTFYAATVAAGAVDLAPSLYTEADTFYSPTVAPGAVSLAPDLFTDGDTFYQPTVSPGAVNLSPSLYTEADSFYTAAIGGPPGGQAGSPIGLLLTLTKPEAVGGGTGSPIGLLLTLTRAVGAPADVSPPLFTDADTLYAPTVGASYALAPELFVEADVFYQAAITGGAVVEPPAVGGLGGSGIWTRERRERSRRDDLDRIVRKAFKKVEGEDEPSKPVVEQVARKIAREVIRLARVDGLEDIALGMAAALELVRQYEAARQYQAAVNQAALAEAMAIEAKRKADDDALALLLLLS